MVTNTFELYSEQMQNLMDAAIKNAALFCYEMMEEQDELGDITPNQFKDSVMDQASFFMQGEIDPDYNEFQLPSKLLKALEERIKTSEFIKISLGK